jgi:hypothetical protein
MGAQLKCHHSHVRQLLERKIADNVVVGGSTLPVIVPIRWHWHQR